MCSLKTIKIGITAELTSIREVAALDNIQKPARHQTVFSAWLRRHYLKRLLNVKLYILKGG